MNRTYLDTARLLTRVAPLVFVDDTFALKGGTAIDLSTSRMSRGFRACVGSCKIWSGCAKPMFGNSPSSRWSLRDDWRRTNAVANASHPMCDRCQASRTESFGEDRQLRRESIPCGDCEHFRLWKPQKARSPSPAIDGGIFHRPLSRKSPMFS